MKVLLLAVVLIIISSCIIEQSNNTHKYSYQPIQFFQEEIDHYEDIFVREQLEQEADIIIRKGKPYIAGFILTDNDSFLLVESILSDTLLKVYYTEIDTIYLQGSAL